MLNVITNFFNLFVSFIDSLYITSGFWIVVAGLSTITVIFLVIELLFDINIYEHNIGIHYD